MSFHFLISLFSMLTFASATSVRTMPNCQSTCGDISIPYPFGIGEGCYQNKGLELRCNDKFTPPRLLYGNAPVRDISLNGTMTIVIWMAIDCYLENGTRSNNVNQNLGLSNYYTYSNTRNKFTAIGCDTRAFMSDRNPKGKYFFQSGCVSLCASTEIVEESCSGIGCCQTAIPKGMKSFYFDLSSYFNHRASWKFNPCSYAFLADTEVFKFSRSDLLDIKGGRGQDFLNDFKNETRYPAVLDWVVGLDSCEDITKNLTSYACGINSDCVDSKHGLGYGYTCNCKEGYEGNPYFTDGCQDINECFPGNSCGKKNSICKNFPGSYTCSCPPGYTDQDLDGKNCIALVINVKPKTMTQVGLGIGGGLLIFFVILFWTFWGIRERNRVKRKAEFFRKNGGSLLKKQISTHGGRQESSCIFTADELERATHNYNEILGQGGFGTVYKGTLPDKRIVAIKKSKIVDRNQIEQFINEFMILSQVNHPNVVKLYGCCLETEVPLLAYEYVSNGNLFEKIHENKGGIIISWENRLRIAAETAKALAYLHSELSIPIIHRDIKSANILLEDNFTVKVADFGISKLVQLDQTQMSTIVQGTFGYLDPEYFRTGQLTEKSDVYSFGVVLLELLTGKKPICFNRSPEERSLVDYFNACLKQNRLFHIVEPQIIHEGQSKQIISYSELAKRCLSWISEERPIMEEVVMELEGLREYEMHPWIPQTNEENRSLHSKQKDLHSIELSSYTGNGFGQYSMDVMPMNVPGR